MILLLKGSLSFAWVAGSFLSRQSKVGSEYYLCSFSGSDKFNSAPGPDGPFSLGNSLSYSGQDTYADSLSGIDSDPNST